MVGIPAVDKVGYFCLLVVSHHDVDAFDVGHLLAVQLGIASRHHHHGIRVSARQFPDFLSAFLVSQFRHRASVDHANVGRLARLHRLCATVGEKLAMVEVSAKLSLHPNVWNATFLLSKVVLSII